MIRVSRGEPEGPGSEPRVLQRLARPHRKAFDPHPRTRWGYRVVRQTGEPARFSGSQQRTARPRATCQVAPGVAKSAPKLSDSLVHAPLWVSARVAVGTHRGYEPSQEISGPPRDVRLRYQNRGSPPLTIFSLPIFHSVQHRLSSGRNRPHPRDSGSRGLFPRFRDWSGCSAGCVPGNRRCG